MRSIIADSKITRRKKEVESTDMVVFGIDEEEASVP